MRLEFKNRNKIKITNINIQYNNKILILKQDASKKKNWAKVHEQENYE